MSVDANGNAVAPAAAAAAAPAQAAPAPVIPNPHPAAVQPPPASAQGLTVNYNVSAPATSAGQTAPPQIIAAPPIPGIPAAATQQTVTIPLEQLQAFTSVQARLAEIEARQRADQEAARQEQARILAQKGEVENALRMLREQSDQAMNNERQKFAQVEDRAKRYALDGEVSRALAAHNLVPGGADQLAHLWRGQFIVDASGESFVVRTPTFQSVGDFVKQQLAQPEYAHFIRASTQGGTATGQTVQTAHTPPAVDTPGPQPRNMGEAVILHMQGMQKAQGDARANMNLPMGLKAHAR